MPVSVGVPLIVIRLADQLAVTPAGSPMGVPMPVAPEDTMVILVRGVLTQRVGVEDGILADPPSATTGSLRRF